MKDQCGFFTDPMGACWSSSERAAFVVFVVLVGLWELRKWLKRLSRRHR